MTITLEHALECHARGWAVLPALPSSKKPACGKWAQYQTERPSEGLLRCWFGGLNRRAMALVLGEVSGGVVCRDYDDIPAYERWAAEHPSLAETLATAETGRPGRHVYGRADLQKFRERFPGRKGIIPYSDGELRTAGIVLLPPSDHKSGKKYRWLIPPEDNLPIVDLDSAGWLPCDTVNTEDSRHLRGATSTVYSASTVSHDSDHASNGPNNPNPNPKTPRSNWSADQTEQINFAIASCLPTKKGQRHALLFKLARELRAIPALANSPPEAIKPYLKKWHAGAVGTIATKPFEESWLDFAEGWQNVKFPAGQGPIDLAFAKASISTLPACAAGYEQQAVRLLVCLCRELQALSGQEPFFLSSRTAAALLQVDHATAARWLKLLRLDGVLYLVTEGSKKTGRASTYVYKGGD